MKAERRHELAENDLARKIVQAPDYWKQYGGRIMLAVTVVAVVALLVSFKMRSSREGKAQAQVALTTARERVAQLGHPMMTLNPRQEQALARKDAISTVTDAIRQVNELSNDRKMLAEAATTEGDFYWTLANLPALPGAATQPSLELDVKPEAALSQAEAAYQSVLNTYSDQKMPVITARFGLAAIAENRGKWSEAKAQYEAIINSDAMDAYKEVARRRERALVSLQSGNWLTVAGATTLPAAGAATTQAVAK